MSNTEDSGLDAVVDALGPTVRLEAFGALKIPIASLRQPVRLPSAPSQCTAELIRAVVCDLLPEHVALLKRSAIATSTRVISEGELIDSETLRAGLVLLPPVSGG